MRLFLVTLAAVFLAVDALLAVGAVVAFSNYESSYQGRIYPGVSALGVDLSGQPPEGARQLLAEQLRPMAVRPFSLAYGDREWRYTATQLGLELDVEPLVQQAMRAGRQSGVLDRWRSLWQLRHDGTELGAIQPRIKRETVQQAVRNIAEQLDRPAIDASVALEPPFEVRVTPSRSGRRVDQTESARRVLEAMTRATDRIELAVAELAPSVQDQHVAAAAEKARLVLSGPLTVYYGDHTWTVSRDELRRALHIERRADTFFEAVVDRKPFEALAQIIAAQIQQDPIDARFSWSSGRLEVLRPSRPGLSVEPGDAVKTVLAAATGPNRKVEVPVKVVKSAVPMEDRLSLGIKELVEQSSTSFAGSVPAKRHNIRLAAEKISGVVLPPGATFSFNEAVGPTTLEAGFRWGFAIQGGPSGHKTIPSVAGGICQVATTLFQSVFWSGYPIEERYPHLYWIPNYTSKNHEGIDTTVDEDSGLDFRFINPTSHHLLIEAWVDNSDKLQFALYGTKPGWTVSVDKPIKTNIRPSDPTAIEEDDATAVYPQRVVVEAARDGFDLRLIRKVTAPGESEPRTLTLVSHYQPSRNVTLVGTIGRPPPTPTPTAQEATPSSTPATGESPTPTASPRPAASPAPTAQPATSTSTPAQPKPSGRGPARKD